jgi:lysozyme
MMKISNNGVAIIKTFEGLRLSAYTDSAGVWTIGYGSTRYQNGKVIKPNDKLANEQQADILFRNTLNQYENAVTDFVKITLTQNQFDALVSFTYNVGIYALKDSSLLQKLNKGDYASVAEAFLPWDKITDPKTGKKIALDTLTKRRQKERDLFLTS